MCVTARYPHRTGSQRSGGLHHDHHPTTHARAKRSRDSTPRRCSTASASKRPTPEPGPSQPIETSGPHLASINPATGEPIAARALRRPPTTTSAVAPRPQRGVPRVARPGRRRRRGEVVRQLGDAPARAQGGARPAGHARGRQDPAPRGCGEVQEMIDMADFAVGLSRQLYGLTMHSERPAAPDVRAVAPARPGRRHHRLQLPGRGVGLERDGRGRLRRLDDLEAVAPGAADRDRGARASPHAGAATRTARRRSSTW